MIILYFIRRVERIFLVCSLRFFFCWTTFRIVFGVESNEILWVEVNGFISIFHNASPTPINQSSLVKSRSRIEPENYQMFRLFPSIAIVSISIELWFSQSFEMLIVNRRNSHNNRITPRTKNIQTSTTIKYGNQWLF